MSINAQALERAMAEVTPFASDLAGVGGRTELRSSVLNLPAERLREAMEDPEREAQFIRALDYGLKRGERTCLRIYAEARKLVGTQINLAAVIVQTVGAQPHEARAAVDAQRNAAAMVEDKRLLARRSVEFLREYAAETGGTVAEVIDGMSGAEVENG